MTAPDLAGFARFGFPVYENLSLTDRVFCFSAAGAQTGYLQQLMEFDLFAFNRKFHGVFPFYDMNESILYNGWFWTVVTAIAFALCTLIPIRIKDTELRQKVTWWVLIPVSLVILLYIYPVGIEFCRRWAVGL